jgi:hypothetical protein
MVTKWTKKLICKKCECEFVTQQRYRYDWGDETLNATYCALCGNGETHWVKLPIVKKPDKFVVDEEDSLKLLKKITDMLFDNDLSHELTSRARSALERNKGLPHHSNDWDKGVMVPLPGRTGSFQATGLSFMEFEKSNWESDFTLDEYRMWRKEYCNDGDASDEC